MTVLVGVGAALVSYLGLGIAVWQLTESLLALSVYILAVVVAFLVLRLRRIRRAYDELAREHAVSVAAAEELSQADNLSRGMFALVVYLTELPRADTRHHLTFVKEEYTIIRDDGIYTWTLEGFNVLSTPSRAIYVKITGDSPVDAAEIPIDVVDRLHGERKLVAKCIGDRPNCKTYAIEFLEPLQMGAEFRIRLSCRWNNTFPRSRSRDYVYSGWGSFAAQGIDRLVGRLVCDTPITDVLLERIEDAQKLREPRQPLIEEVAPQRSIVEWEVPHPQSIYVLSFTKLVRG